MEVEVIGALSAGSVYIIIGDLNPHGAYHPCIPPTNVARTPLLKNAQGDHCSHEIYIIYPKVFGKEFYPDKV